MSEWKEFIISDLCSAIIDCVNKTAPLSSTPTPYRMIRTSDVRNGFINLEGLNSVTEETFIKWTRRGLLKEGDVIFSREAPLGEAAIVRNPKNYFLGQRLILYRANPKLCDNRFLLYWFLNPINKEGLKTRGVGSTVTHMRVPECERIKITAPDLKEQKRIADILTTYDSLIESNQRQIKLLEEAAQRLYKEWFVDLRYPGHENVPVVDGVPEGWKLSTIDSRISLLSGFAFKSKEFDDLGRYKIVTIKNVKDGKFDGESTSRIISIPKNMPNHCVLNEGDILLSLTGNVGRVCIVTGNDYLLNQRVAKLQSDIPAFTYCLFRNRDTFDAMNNLANGAAQQNLSPIRTGKITVLFPSDLLTQKFELIAGRLIKNITQTSHTGNSLRTLKIL